MIPTLTWSLRRKRVQWAVGGPRCGTDPGSIPGNPLGRDADERKRDALEGDRSAENGGIETQAASPVPVADHELPGDWSGRSSSVVRARPWEVLAASGHDDFFFSIPPRAPVRTRRCSRSTGFREEHQRHPTGRCCGRGSARKPKTESLRRFLLSRPPRQRRTCCGFFTGSILRMTASIRLRIAVFAPMPSVRVRIRRSREAQAITQGAKGKPKVPGQDLHRPGNSARSVPRARSPKSLKEQARNSPTRSTGLRFRDRRVQFRTLARMRGVLERRHRLQDFRRPGAARRGFSPSRIFPSLKARCAWRTGRCRARGSRGRSSSPCRSGSGRSP